MSYRPEMGSKNLPHQRLVWYPGYHYLVKQWIFNGHQYITLVYNLHLIFSQLWMLQSDDVAMETRHVASWVWLSMWAKHWWLKIKNAFIQTKMELIMWSDYLEWVGSPEYFN